MSLIEHVQWSLSSIVCVQMYVRAISKHRSRYITQRYSLSHIDQISLSMYFIFLLENVSMKNL